MARKTQKTHHDPPPQILTVSQLTRRVKGLLEDEVGYVWVSGEVSNLRVSPAGHAYFTLKDAQSQIDAVMFHGRFQHIHFDADNGLEIIAFGLVSVYEKRGNYQLICEELHPKGLGALQLAFEKLKKKLDEEGLFDEKHKKPLPMLPRRIGIVTSPTGAPIRDMLNVIRRRFAQVHVLIYPSRVQGDEAAEEIVEGIRVLDQLGVDVMIIGRGGGSLEDLWPFNEEILVRAVFEAKTPIISAVGHEIDFALTDFAADLRAPTPSAAAELVVREQEALLERIRLLGKRMGKAESAYIERAANRVALQRSSYVFRRPGELIRQRRQRVDELRQQLTRAVRDKTNAADHRFKHSRRSLALLSPSMQVSRAGEQLARFKQRLTAAGPAQVERLRGRCRPVFAQLHALSPLGVLSRGYALAWTHPEGRLVRDAHSLEPDDILRVQFGQGSVITRVERIGDSGNG
ncbi:MAG: exodeoxyribonuclease VII large subunit [Candidatus Hydrogenedentes bacterium]|nr:exodeoxyribonuclease VII large subunit [Candidatus Hydrogenedentota bacterium]